MIYHGTTSKNLESIRKQGLKPRGQKKGNWKHLDNKDSVAGNVYLTALYAPYFAYSATRGHKHVPMIVEVDLDRLDEANLCPDEDFIVQATSFPSHIDANDYAREVIDQNRYLWKSSLERLGNVSHVGVVPVEAITRVSLIHMHLLPPNLFMSLIFALGDPSICIQNKMFMGDKYMELTKLLMKDKYDVKPLVSSSIELYDHIESYTGDDQVFLTMQTMQRQSAEMWSEIYKHSAIEVLEIN